MIKVHRQTNCVVNVVKCKYKLLLRVIFICIPLRLHAKKLIENHRYGQEKEISVF